MYCRKCGKWVDGDAELCVECQQEENGHTAQQPATYQSAQPVQSFYGVELPAPKYTGSRMKKFGLALAAVIVAQFAMGFFLGIILGIEEALGGYNSSTMYIIVDDSIYAFFVIGFALAAFSTIAGLVSVCSGFGAKKRGEVTPIPAIILGFIALAEMLITFLIAYEAVTLLKSIL